MKIHLSKAQTLIDYTKHNSRSISFFEEFSSNLKSADWYQPIDIKSTFNSADILGKGTNRVIFNIGGNEYRIICKYRFAETRVRLYIMWIGTHAEYDKLCKKGLQYSISNY